MEPNYEIKNANLKFMIARRNYYKQMIYYFKFLDDSYKQLDKSYTWYKNLMFGEDNKIIGILDIQDFHFNKNQNYICNIELIDSPSLNPRIRNRYYHAKILTCESLPVDDLFID